MEQSSWEADSPSAGQENSAPFMEPGRHYRVHKSSPLDAILSQMNSLHILTPYFFKINFNKIVLQLK